MEWISIKDKIPPMGQTVLIFCTITIQGISLAYVEERGGRSVWCDWDTSMSLDGVTHWMPLPEPPKQD